MKKNYFALLVFVLTSASSLFSQDVLKGSQANDLVPNAEEIWLSSRSAAPKHIRMRSGSEIPYQYFPKWIRHNLHMQAEDNLVLMKSERDELGLTHYRMQQTYQGVPVEGANYLAHARGSKVVSVNGEIYLPLSLSVSPALSEAQALQKALDHVGAQLYKWQVPGEEAALRYQEDDFSATYFPKGELVIVPDQGNYDQGNFKLAWKFDVYAHQPESREYIFVDAQNGNINWKINRIHTADVTGSAVTRYSGTQPMVADFTGSTYRLRESGRGLGIETYDLNKSTNFGSAVDFTDGNNVWNNVNADQDEVATDAHWGAEMTYDYLLNVHGRNSINGSGYKLLSYVHYSTNYNNASWDGQRMRYGDGNGTTFTPLTAIDVAGHEIGHGLTTFSANLTYSYESGALNESFSDIQGTNVEKFGRPSNWNWKIGEDMTPGGGGIRNMANPNQFSQPDTYLGNMWYTGTGDNGGVHYNSGVQNFWFYLLSQGGSGTNDNSNSYSVTGQGTLKASKIAFRNLTVYLTPNSQYADARYYAIQAAIDLYGPCSPEVIATTNAWYAVGVGGPFSYAVNSDFTVDAANFCSIPATANFSNLSTNAGTYTWDFGDGNTSTVASPTHVYATWGTYTVSLIANGGACGNDTMLKVAYVHVDSNISCSVNLNPSGPNGLQTSCSGTLFDSGGPSANYQDNTNTAITISPPGASSVVLTFQSFDFEANYDFLYIYDGPSTASPLIGSYTGNTLPNGGTITSTTGSVTLRQFSDPFVNGTGFQLNWTCVMPNSPPSTDFEADKTTTCSGIIQFSDLTTGGANSWHWDFGDGSLSTLQNPIHTYTSNGVYTVTLATVNSIGADTMIKVAYVTVNKPAGPAATGASICGTGTATLNATGSGPFKWYDTQNGTTPVGTGSSFTTPVISTTTDYYVEEEVPQTTQKVGPPTNNFGTGSNFTNNTRNLFFDVASSCKLVSVLVYAQTAGNRTIEWRTSLGSLIKDTTVNIPSGQSRVTLNFDLVPGAGYELGLSPNSAIDLYRNNSGAVYPYTLAGLVSITGSDAGQPGFYYFFYDWEIQPSSCISERTVVTATVNQVPSAVVTPSGPTTFCSGGSVTLSATGGTSYLWSNGATTSSITVTTSGNYTCTVTDANGCSATSTAVSVTVNSAPTANITANGPLTFCQGGSVVLTATTSSSYLWSTGATTKSITVTSSGNYTVTVTNGNGCSKTSLPTAVTVNPLPTANITAGGPTTFCTGGSVTLTSTAGSSYSWSNGATTQAITVTTSGNYTVTVTNSSGCSATSSAVTVTVNSGGSATITPSGPTTFCQGGSVTLTANSGSSYLWSTGATTQSIVVNSTGNYSVTVTTGNCSATSSATSVTVSAPPTASITPGGPTTFCSGGSVILTANSGSSYLWSTGATTQSITVSTAGSYSVSVTNSSGCSATSSAVSVTVNSLPTASISASGPTTFCQGGSVTLTASSATSWLWSNGATTQSITVTTGGSYSVTVTNANNCSKTSSAVFVTVNSLPSTTITAGGPTTFCQGGSVTLSAPSASSWLWSTGATTQSITVSTAGTYSVTVTSAAGCSATSAGTVVTVNQNPTATISASGPTTFCQGSTVTLTASSGSSYLWSTGATTQSIVVNSTGNYSVTVTNSSNCSATSAPVSVAVNAPATANISAGGATSFCQGGSVTLTATSGTSYLWSTGATSQSITVTTSGSYTVTVTNSSGCSATSSATQVTVNAPPTPTITANGPTTICPGNSVVLTASTASAYNWSNGATTQSITVTTSGTFTVTVTDGNGCTGTSAPVTTTVSNTPQANITPAGNSSICQGDTLVLTATAGTAYLWSNGATTQSISVMNTGTYSVTVTFPGGCTATSANAVVTVNAPATANITASGPTTFCDGGSVVLTATGGTSFLWSNGATTSSITSTQSGNYSVTVTNANGCSATSAATPVTVNQPVPATITANGPLAFCDGESVELTASNGTSWLWSNGATTQSVVVTASGNYDVMVTDANGCDATSSAVTVTVNANPVADFSFTTNNLDATFTDLTGTGTTWDWSFGDGNSSTQQNPVHTYGANGNYSVTLIVTNANGCSDTVTKDVAVEFVGIEENDFGLNQIYPNPFNQSVQVSLDLRSGGVLKIELSDLLGRVLVKAFEGEVPAGTFVEEFNLADQLADGPYLMNFTFNGKRYSKKLLKVN
ncbi:MAG: M4 family metallopeptidase [Bacteroidia bacterium]|nr:M4 family metallopeptidase [Bacteroidia bacterium]